jgi:hypothetical protein
MKKIIQNVLSISLCLIAFNVTAQVPRPKPITIKKELNTDLSKINQKPIPKINTDITKKYFTQLKSGTENSKEGARELTLVNNNFPETNKTTVQKGSVINNANSICTKETITVEIKALDFKAFSMNAKPDWLKPGIMMKAMSFIDGSNTIEEIKDRNPITLSSDLKIANPVFEVMNPSKKSQITTAENYFIRQDGNPVPAQMTFYYHEVHSLEEMSFKLTGKYSSGMGMFSGSVGLNYGTEKESNYYMIEFSQNMFSIEVDGMNPAKVFVDPTVSTEDYIYLSKVNYGRKGVIVFKTNKKIEEMGLSLSAKVSGVVGSGEVKAAYNSLKSNSDVEMQAFYYGGSSAGVIQSIENSIKNGVPDIISYLKDRPFDHKLALPIGYELKNLKNERVGLDNKLKQVVRTCITKQDYKLKVTLTDIQNIDGRDGSDNPDDYAIQQSIVYTSKGRDMVQSKTDFNKFPNTFKKCTLVPNNVNTLICGDGNNQIHVRQNNKVSQRNTSQINNSMVFNLPYDYYADPNASFKIHTWVKEYTSGKDKVLTGNTKISVVNIKDVMDALSGNKPLLQNKDLYDKSINVTVDNKAIKFDSFGNEVMMANIQDINGKIILDYPIIVGSPGAKAVVWLSFELVK